MSFHRVTLVALALLLTVGMTSLAEAQQAPIGGYGAVWGFSSYGSWCSGGYAPGTVYAPAADYPTRVRGCYPGYGDYPPRGNFISRSR